MGDNIFVQFQELHRYLPLLRFYILQQPTERGWLQLSANLGLDARDRPLLLEAARKQYAHFRVRDARQANPPGQPGLHIALACDAFGACQKRSR